MTVYIASYHETHSSKYICHVYYHTITKVFAFFANSNVSHRIYSAGKWSGKLNDQYYKKHDNTDLCFISYENTLNIGYLDNLLLEKILNNFE